MTRINRIIRRLAIGIAGALLITGCQNKDYFVDGGTHSPYYDGTIMDYLRSRPDIFTKLVEIIELTGMEEVIDSENITFFAPPDPAIDNSIRKLNERLYTYMGRDRITTMDQVNASVWREFLSMYIVEERYLLKDIPQLDTTALNSFPGQAYITYGKRPMNLGVVYHDYGKIKYAGHRQLLISYVDDFINARLINAYVATSDIQPTNGVLHVIRYGGHHFGFDIQQFIDKAISEGITYPQSTDKR
jgi:hypothetical protein